MLEHRHALLAPSLSRAIAQANRFPQVRALAQTL